MRAVLDPVSPLPLRTLFVKLSHLLSAAGAIKQFHYWQQHVIFSIDGGESSPLAQGLEDFDFGERRMFLDAMNLRVEAAADRFRFSFNIPTNPDDGRYVVSGQISGSMPFQSLLVRG